MNDPRPFTLVEDDYPEGTGQPELETTISYSRHTRIDSRFNLFQVEHEFEIGLSDNFDLKIPVSYHYEDSSGVHETRFDTFAIQADYYVLSPSVNVVGLGLFSEVGVGENTLEFSETLVLQKDFGKWTVAYNLGAQTEIAGVFHRRGGDTETTGTLVNALGVSYNITPTMALGAEIQAESAYADWSTYQGTSTYAGPVLLLAGHEHWWLTVGPHARIGHQKDQPDFEVTVILGVTF